MAGQYQRHCTNIDAALDHRMVQTYTALQRQKAVTAHLKSKQLLPFGFALGHLFTCVRAPQAWSGLFSLLSHQAPRAEMAAEAADGLPAWCSPPLGLAHTRCQEIVVCLQEMAPSEKEELAWKGMLSLTCRAEINELITDVWICQSAAAGITPPPNCK